MENIEVVLKEPLKAMDLAIEVIVYEKGQLNITLDSLTKETLNIDKIVEATKVISKLLDKHDFIKEHYILDVSSKERGDEEKWRAVNF